MHMLVRHKVADFAKWNPSMTTIFRHDRRPG